VKIKTIKRKFLRLFGVKQKRRAKKDFEPFVVGNDEVLIGDFGPADRQTPTWAKLERHLNMRLASLREQNDGDSDAVATATRRGRIAEVKYLLVLGKERAPVIQE